MKLKNEQAKSLAFFTEIDGSQHRLLLLKTNGKDVYGWTWIDVPDVISRSRIEGPPVRIETKGSHLSYHWDGRRHRRLELAKGERDKPFVGRTQPWKDWGSWRQFFVLSAPLTNARQHLVICGPWKEAQQQVVLRASEFAAEHIWLNVLITKSAWVEKLRCEYERSWVLLHDPLSVVVGVWQ